MLVSDSEVASATAVDSMSASSSAARASANEDPLTVSPPSLSEMMTRRVESSVENSDSARTIASKSAVSPPTCSPAMAASASSLPASKEETVRAVSSKAMTPTSTTSGSAETNDEAASLAASSGDPAILPDTSITSITCRSSFVIRVSETSCSALPTIRLTESASTVSGLCSNGSTTSAVTLPVSSSRSTDDTMTSRSAPLG